MCVCVYYLLIGGLWWSGKEDAGHLSLVPGDRHHRVAPLAQQVHAGSILSITLYGTLTRNILFILEQMHFCKQTGVEIKTLRDTWFCHIPIYTSIRLSELGHSHAQGVPHSDFTWCQNVSNSQVFV